MGTLTVRVTPRAARPGVEVRDGLIVVRVHAPAVEGRATEEARRRIAEALGVPAARVTLRAGASSRVKVFQVEGVSDEAALLRLRG